MNFIDKQNKISILQERANLYNQIQDHLIDQDVPEHLQGPQIHQYLEQYTNQQAQQQVNTVADKSQSFAKPQVSVLTTSALLSLGINNYPHLQSTNQKFNESIDKRNLQYKELKKEGKLEQFIAKERKEKQDNEQTQQIIFKSDHLKEYEDIAHQGYHNQKSSYQDFHKSMPIKQDTRNNLVKNDLNTYFEAYIKHKSTLRGVPHANTKKK